MALHSSITMDLHSSITMALHSSITKDGDICASYMQIHILMSDECKAEILDSDSDIPHNSST